MDTPTLTVADVMTIDPVVVNADDSIEEAVQLLKSYGITGLPVIDADGMLVGVISETDLVSSPDSAVGRLVRAQPSGFRVGELMTSPAVTIQMDASLVEAARNMLDRRIHRLVAVDEHGRPVGVLSAFDFVALYADR
jgi:CBS-domain-containing membrane protein